MKSDGLKKHHFWLLLASVPVLVGLLLILILFGPSTAIAEQETKNKAISDAVGGAKAPGVGMLTELATQKETLELRRTQLWGVNYERQKAAGVFAWPSPYSDPARGDQFLKALEKRDLRFGAKEVATPNPAIDADAQYVVLNDEMAKFTASSNYLESYTALAKSILPTRFDGAGWQTVLRTVTDWGTGRPDSNTFWLALEDYWIQRALLKPIAEVNDGAKKFELVKPEAGAADTPLKRTFRNRTWQIEIELDANRVLKSKLTNRTDRLQMLGTNKSMRMKVWLDDPKPSNSQPFEYRIGGEMVKGSGELSPKVVPELHRIPAGTGGEAIFQIEQILDEVTVPVRLVRRVEIGYRDSKRSTAELKAPSFFPEEAIADPAGGNGMNPMPGPGGGPPAMPGPPRGGPGPGAPGRSGAPGDVGAKTGTAEQMLIANRKRYLERTEQVRRMPVGVDLVVDQAYVNDVLVAFGNSPLRFQVTQTQWQRFRDPLGTSGTGGSGSESDLGTAPPMFPGAASLPPGFGGFGGGSSSSAAALPTSQVTAGLVELAVYGIVSIYEKVKVKPPEAGKTTELKTEPKPGSMPEPKPGPMPEPKPEPKPDAPVNPGVPPTAPPK